MDKQDPTPNTEAVSNSNMIGQGIIVSIAVIQLDGAQVNDWDLN
jgi:hypothetical protein